MDYYYTTPDNQPRGPVSVDELRSLSQTGAIDSTCRVAAVGSQEWVPLASILPVPPSTMPVPPTAVGATPFTAQTGRTEPLAVWSLVLSLLGLICCTCFGSIPAIVCGHLALSSIARTPGVQGRGLAIAGLCIGYFGLIIWPIIWFLCGGIQAFNEAMQKAQQHH